MQAHLRRPSEAEAKFAPETLGSGGSDDRRSKFGGRGLKGTKLGATFFPTSATSTDFKPSFTTVFPSPVPSPTPAPFIKDRITDTPFSSYIPSPTPDVRNTFVPTSQFVDEFNKERFSWPSPDPSPTPAPFWTDHSSLLDQSTYLRYTEYKNIITGNTDQGSTMGSKVSVDEFRRAVESDTSFLVKNDLDLINFQPPTYLMIRIPFDSSDPNHYYTVEYRKRSGIDSGIPQDNTVLIHEVKRLRDNDGKDVGHRSYLIRNLTAPGKPPATWLNENGIYIKVLSVGNVAVIHVRQACINHPAIYIPGIDFGFFSTPSINIPAEEYYFRQACPNDYTCVDAATLAQTLIENSLAASRVDTSRGPQGYCLQGYVWREACPGTEVVEGVTVPIDRVCVTPDRRSQAKVDDFYSSSRSSDVAKNGIANYGPNACKDGYVWRDADESDYVCVEGWVRDQVAADNRAHPSRRRPDCDAIPSPCPYGKQTCLDGWVWRDAFPGDQICVTRDTRNQAASDNQQAQARLAVVAA